MSMTSLLLVINRLFDPTCLHTLSLFTTFPSLRWQCGLVVSGLLPPVLCLSFFFPLLLSRLSVWWLLLRVLSFFVCLVYLFRLVFGLLFLGTIVRCELTLLLWLRVWVILWQRMMPGDQTGVNGRVTIDCRFRISSDVFIVINLLLKKINLFSVARSLVFVLIHV